MRICVGFLAVLFAMAGVAVAMPAVDGAVVRSAKKSLLKPMAFAKTISDMPMEDRWAIEAEGYDPYYGFTAYQYLKLIEQEEIAQAAMENIEACEVGDADACADVQDEGEDASEDLQEEGKDSSEDEEGTTGRTSGNCSVRHPHYQAGQKIPFGMPIDLDDLSNRPGVRPYLIQIYRQGQFGPYGCRPLPEYYTNPDVECNNQTKRPHKGVDVGSGAPFYRAPVFATADGVVERAVATNDSAGKYIKIDHGNNFKTLYMHLDEILVQKGQNVQAGCIIGYMGHSGGNADKANPSMGIGMTHLHYEIHYNGTAREINAPDGGVVSIVRGDSDCPQNCESEKRKFWPAIRPNDFMTFYENRR